MSKQKHTYVLYVQWIVAVDKTSTLKPDHPPLPQSIGSFECCVFPQVKRSPLDGLEYLPVPTIGQGEDFGEFQYHKPPLLVTHGAEIRDYGPLQPLCTHNEVQPQLADP